MIVATSFSGVAELVIKKFSMSNSRWGMNEKETEELQKENIITLSATPVFQERARIVLVLFGFLSTITINPYFFSATNVSIVLVLGSLN